MSEADPCITTATTSLIPDEAGTWKLWPCYAVQHNDGERLCPDEWRAFPIEVDQ